MSSIAAQKRASTWNIDDGYKNEIKLQDSYPFRSIDAGVQYSLSVILKINNNDIDYLCGGSQQGYKISFHSPCDVPRIRTHSFILPPNRAAFYSIEPSYTRTEPKVREFDPQKRQCYFTNERKLRFFRHYTRMLCILECLSNYTLAQCGCVYFPMMRKPTFASKINPIRLNRYYIMKTLGTSDTKICGPAKMRCCKDTQKHFYTGGEFNKCDCLPSCSALSYTAYSSMIDFDYARALSQTVEYKDVDLGK